MKYICDKKIMIYYFRMLIFFIVNIYVYIFCTNHEYKYMYLIISSYIILNIIFAKVLFNVICSDRIISRILFIIFDIRYVVMPCTIVATGYYSGYGFNPSRSSLNLAILLMIYEMIIAFIVMNVLDKKNNILKKNKEIEFLKNKSIIIIYIIITLIIVYFLRNSKNGIFQIINFSGKTCVFLILVSCLYNLYLKKKKKIYVIITVLIYIIYILSLVETSRWTIVMAILGIGVINKELFKEYNKVIMLSIIIIGVLGFFSISMYKFSWAVQGSSTPYSDLIFTLSKQLQDYFSGPRTIAQAIEMSKIYNNNITILTLINDFLGSVPGIANFINQQNRINYYFNDFIFANGKTTIIIPMISSGFIYFKIIFAPLFSAICIWIAGIFERKILKSNILEYKYVYIYIGFLLAMFSGFNIQIIFGNVIVKALPLLLILHINRKINFN